ncbi:hypothetical protein EBR43_11080 [bacterium]|nr:hypothetical protein [bacterium]
MTTINIERMERQMERSNKSHKGKTMSGAKERATKRYFKDTAARSRRKQGKARFNTTHRREEQMDPEDERLEEMHFANFLGCGKSHFFKEGRVSYHTYVNINHCDVFVDKKEADSISEYDDDSYILSIEEQEIDLIDMRQIEREPNVKWDMNWYYNPITTSLIGQSSFKRARNDDDTDEEQPAIKRIKNQDEYLAEMVAYMKQQVELAQQMAADELYICDCDHN